MDLKKKRELLTEIVTVANKTSNKQEKDLNLLDMLNSFDRVMSIHKMDPESIEAMDLYKSLLKLGRIGTKSWADRIEQNLDISGTGTPIESSFVKSQGPPKSQEKSMRKLSDIDLRAPLMNLTNKTMSPAFHNTNIGINNRYLSEEIAMPQASQTSVPTRIQLPKLQLTHLFEEQKNNFTASTTANLYTKPYELTKSSPAIPKLASSQGILQTEKISALEIKLENLKLQPAERESEVFESRIQDGSNDLIAASYHVFYKILK